jgi:hypothetical protein
MIWKQRDDSRPGGGKPDSIDSRIDSVLDAARAVAKQSDELISALDAVERRLLDTDRPIPEPASPIRRGQPEPELPRSELPSDSATFEGARLLATQMAVAGSSRDEIAARLLEEFGIEDASTILDEIGI